MSEPQVERINGILCLCWQDDNIPLRYIGACLGEMVLEREAEIERLQKIAAMIECPRCGYKPKAVGEDDAPAKPTPPTIELVKDGFFKTTVRKAGGE